MAYTPNTFDDWSSLFAAAVAANVQVIVNGQTVAANFSVGSTFYTLQQVIALTLDAFSRQLSRVDSGLRLATATGTDLDDLGALLGAPRYGGTQALAPFKVTRLSATSSAVTIPSGKQFLAPDSTGAPKMGFLTQQDPTQSVGISGFIPANQQSGWVWGLAQNAGAAGNLAANQTIQLGQLIPGVDLVSNPQVASPAAPTITTAGAAGGTTYQYEVVALGVTGKTLPSTAGQTTTGNAVLNGTNYTIITWPLVTDAVSYDVLKLVGGVWVLLVNTTATTVNDQGGATTSYALPTSNTTNTGTGGADPEGDIAYRARIPLALSVAATSTATAVSGAVKAVTGVTSVFVQDAVVGGSPAPGTANLLLVTQSNPLPAASVTAVNAAIANTKAAGDVVTWSYLTPTTVAVAYTITSTSSAVTATTESLMLPSINTAITTYFSTLSLGQAARYSGVVNAILNAAATYQGTTQPGIAVTNLVMTAGGTYTNSDVPASAGVLYAAGAISSTIV